MSDRDRPIRTFYIWEIGSNADDSRDEVFGVYLSMVAAASCNSPMEKLRRLMREHGLSRRDGDDSIRPISDQGGVQ